MPSVFLVWHSSDPEDDHTAKLLGVFSSRSLASERVERARGASGFAAYPDGFVIDEYPVDVDQWVEGNYGYAALDVAGVGAGGVAWRLSRQASRLEEGLSSLYKNRGYLVPLVKARIDWLFDHAQQLSNISFGLSASGEFIDRLLFGPASAAGNCR